MPNNTSTASGRYYPNLVGKCDYSVAQEIRLLRDGVYDLYDRVNKSSANLFNPKGDWNAFTTYSVGDLVTYLGSSYLAIVSNTGSVPPSSNWQLIASKIGNAAADGTTLGVAAFNSTNFTASAGVINTIQNISTSSSPVFTNLSLSGYFYENNFSGTLNSGYHGLTNIWKPRNSNMTDIVFLDHQDEYAFVDLTANSINITPAYSYGDKSFLFRDSSDWIEWASGSSPFPIVIEIVTTTNPILAKSSNHYRLGITNRGDLPQVNHIKIEVWNGSAYSTQYDADTTFTCNGQWVSPTFGGDNLTNMSKLKLTISGTNPLTNVFRLQRIMLYHDSAPWNIYNLSRSGGTMYGDVVFDYIATGPVVIDTATGSKYRIKVTSGVLGLTAV